MKIYVSPTPAYEIVAEYRVFLYRDVSFLTGKSSTWLLNILGEVTGIPDITQE